MATDISPLAVKTLGLLSHAKNVLVSGPPGTGKSRLLNEVASAFASGAIIRQRGGAVLNPSAIMPIQSRGPVGRLTGSPELAAFMPSPDKVSRAVFQTVFHQNYKHREFLTGVVPVVQRTENNANFKVLKGKLFVAVEHARSADGAALLIIDEINRGPAVQIFGGSIVAIEAEKRLAPDGSVRIDTQRFDIIDPVSGEIQPYALPHDLYILAAMNQADSSVEPMDVAFLRRWEPIALEPDEATLRDWIGSQASGSPLLDVPGAARDVFDASVRAWKKVNRRIALGRGAEFQIGHGILMNLENPHRATLAQALEASARAWARIRAHVEEVFFGDQRGVAAVFNAIDEIDGNPLRLVETTFAGELRHELVGPRAIDANEIYAALKAFSHDFQ